VGVLYLAVELLTSMFSMIELLTVQTFWSFQVMPMTYIDWLLLMLTIN